MPGFEWINDDEKKLVEKVFDNGGVLFRHGFESIRNGVFMVNEFEDKFATALEIETALAVSSGTSALKVALRALGVGPGDEVITQCFTFVATLEAIVEVGATPVVTEIDSTLNMDVADLEKKITPNTKVILPVHMLGTPAAMREIMRLANKHKIKVLEDTAWGCGAKLDGSFLGTIGDVGAFSFDYAKTITTGEGGMVVSNDRQIAANARAYHDHGHENNPNLPRWEDSRSSSGFNYRMSELQAAVGLAQLEKLDLIIRHQKQVGEEFRSRLAKSEGVEFRHQPDGSESSFDAFVFFVRKKELAWEIRRALRASGHNTKILPEAVTWHFAAHWSHIPQLQGQLQREGLPPFPKSFSILSRSVALPISRFTDPEAIAEQCEIILRVVGES